MARGLIEAPALAVRIAPSQHARAPPTHPENPGTSAFHALCIRCAAMQSSWLVARLAITARSHRARAETELASLFAAPDAIAACRLALAGVYKLTWHVEAALAQSLDLSIRFVQRMSETEALARDLLALGLDAPTRVLLARPCPVPRLGTLADALGWTYMLFAGTHLPAKAALARLSPPRSLAYLANRNGLDDARWLGLEEWLEWAAASTDVATAIAAATQCAFEHQRRWFAGAWPSGSNPVAIRAGVVWAS